MEKAEEARIVAEIEKGMTDRSKDPSPRKKPVSKRPTSLTVGSKESVSVMPKTLVSPSTKSRIFDPPSRKTSVSALN